MPARQKAGSSCFTCSCLVKTLLLCWGSSLLVATSFIIAALQDTLHQPGAILGDSVPFLAASFASPAADPLEPGDNADAAPVGKTKTSNLVRPQRLRRSKGLVAHHGTDVTLPADLQLGIGTAAFMIEGAADKRGVSIWDRFLLHGSSPQGQGADPTVACDHYHRFRDDVRIMADLGFRSYQFSISWSRLLPTGQGHARPDGVRFYSDLIDELLLHNIEPWVTLYHWDLPEDLETQLHGWVGNTQRVVEAFGHFARTCFRLFGDRVKKWITFFAPWSSAVLGYTGPHAPGHKKRRGHEPYAAIRNILLAHAEAFRIYRYAFAEQGGQIGIALNARWYEPYNHSSIEEKKLAHQALSFELGIFADPLVHGKFPEVVERISASRLPPLTTTEAKRIKGSIDFLGLIMHTAEFVHASRSTSPKQTGFSFHADMTIAADDASLAASFDKGASEVTDLGWPVMPWALTKLLLHIQRHYAPRGGIVIAANGCVCEEDGVRQLDGRLGMRIPRPYKSGMVHEDFERETHEDPRRVAFLSQHLAAVADAMVQGADVRAYFYWSLLDGLEWNLGYQRWGIVWVDFITQKRTLKSSARFYAKVLRERKFQIVGHKSMWAAVDSEEDANQSKADGVAEELAAKESDVPWQSEKFEVDAGAK